MLLEAAFENLLGILATRPNYRKIDGQVTDSNRGLARRLKIDRPVKQRSVCLERLNDSQRAIGRRGGVSDLARGRSRLHPECGSVGVDPLAIFRLVGDDQAQ